MSRSGPSMDRIHQQLMVFVPKLSNVTIEPFLINTAKTNIKKTHFWRYFFAKWALQKIAQKTHFLLKLASRDAFSVKIARKHVFSLKTAPKDAFPQECLRIARAAASSEVRASGSSGAGPSTDLRSSGACPNL